LTREDYVKVLVPPLRSAVESRRTAPRLYAIGPELHIEPAAVWEDLKVDVELGIKHRGAWERVAVVTDLNWLWRTCELFSWMVPGEMRLFHESELEQAKTWLTQ
jgi:stage II sporulation SpoAA-like protein